MNNADGTYDILSNLKIHPLIYAVLALLVIFFLYQIVGGVVTFLLFGLEFTRDKVQQIRGLLLFGQIFLLLVPALIFIRIQSKSILKFIRFKRIGLPEVVLISLGVVSAHIFLQGYLLLQDQIPLPESVQQLVDAFQEMLEHIYKVLVVAETFPEFLFVVFTIAVVPAISEEVLFRGLVQRNFEYNFGYVGGAVIVGIIFGLYHLNPVNLVPLMGLGIIFGLLVYKTGSIVSAMIAHFVNNLFAVALVHFHSVDGLVKAYTDVSNLVVLSYMILSFTVALLCWILLGKVVQRVD